MDVDLVCTKVKDLLTSSGGSTRRPSPWTYRPADWRSWSANSASHWRSCPAFSSLVVLVCALDWRSCRAFSSLVVLVCALDCSAAVVSLYVSLLASLWVVSATDLTSILCEATLTRLFLTVVQILQETTAASH